MEWPFHLVLSIVSISSVKLILSQSVKLFSYDYIIQATYRKLHLWACDAPIHDYP